MLILALLVSSSLSQLVRAEQQTITWYDHHQPPATFAYGKYKEQGYMDKAVQLLARQLPQYRHTSVVATIGRVEQDMQSGKNLCFAGFYNTPARRTFAVFSQPFVMQAGLRVILPTTLANKLALHSPVNLETLLAEHKLVIGIVSNREYGAVIGNTLERFKNQILARVDHSNIGLFEMLSKNRFDFLIAYEAEANYALREVAPQFDYSIFAIQGIPAFHRATIGCSKTKLGEQVINDINQAIDKISSTPAYFKAMRSWIPDNKLSKEYVEFYRQHFTKE